MADDELCAVVHRGEELRDLDYKGPMAWDERGDRRACCELVKDILAIANTGGGYIVIGVAEVSGGWDWQGLSNGQLDTWDTTRVNRFVQNYADPPINVRLRKVECDGKRFVLLSIPGFSATPHLCQRDYPGALTTPTLYVRTANNESAPIRAAADFRDLIERAVRQRQRQMLEAMRTILTGATVQPGPSDQRRFDDQAGEVLTEEPASDLLQAKGYEGYFISIMFPSRFQQDRFSIDQLRQAAEAASVDYRGWPFLFYERRRDSTVITNDGLRTQIAWQPWGTFDSYDVSVHAWSGVG